MVRFSLRLPDELHEQLKSQARQSGRSLHAEIIWLLEQAMRPGVVDAPPSLALLLEQLDRALTATAQVVRTAEGHVRKAAS